MAKEKNHIEMDGEITRASGREIFRVTLENGMEVVAVPSGKIRMNHIKLMPGDKVRVEMSLYDLTRGRIAYRYRR